jgi:hypothetical protein
MSTADSHPRSANPAAAPTERRSPGCRGRGPGGRRSTGTPSPETCVHYASQLRMPAHTAVLAAAQRRVSEKAVRTVGVISRMKACGSSTVLRR